MNPQNHSSFNILSPTLHRAKVHSNRRQRVFFCDDASLSMNEQNKAADANDAQLRCLQELALPINKDSFEAAVIHFADQAKTIHALEKVTSLVNHLSPLDPVKFAGNGTNITSALELTIQILKKAESSQAQDGIFYVRSLCVVLSDGCQNTGRNPIPVAEELKQYCDVLSIAFGIDADEKMLREIATEQLAIRCRSGAELRCYFAAIGQTLTATRTSGQPLSMVLLPKL